MQTIDIIQQLESVRQTAPLVHNITNYVVMNNTANALLAIGASPVMAHAKEEVGDMVKIASALVLNMGTLDKAWVESMLEAGKKAHALKKPIVFDPVGVGATPYRTAVAQQIIAECHPYIIRGNASEINALVASQAKTKGVDSTLQTQEAITAAQLLQQQTGAVVVISGSTDYIVSSEGAVRLENGSFMMPRVTGMGCTATALLGAFVGSSKNAFLAAVAGMAILGIAGEIAAQQAKGPGTLQLSLLDQLYQLNAEDINTHLRMKYEKF
jgi:hydroxyethylthiazole kinase